MQTVKTHSGYLKKKEEFNGRTLKFHRVAITVRDQEHSEGLDSKNQMVLTPLFSLNKRIPTVPTAFAGVTEDSKFRREHLLGLRGREKKDTGKRGLSISEQDCKNIAFGDSLQGRTSCCWRQQIWGVEVQKAKNNYPDQPHEQVFITHSQVYPWTTLPNLAYYRRKNGDIKDRSK